MRMSAWLHWTVRLFLGRVRRNEPALQDRLRSSRFRVPKSVRDRVSSPIFAAAEVFSVDSATARNMVKSAIGHKFTANPVTLTDTDVSEFNLTPLRFCLASLFR